MWEIKYKKHGPCLNIDHLRDHRAKKDAVQRVGLDT